VASLSIFQADTSSSDFSLIFVIIPLSLTLTFPPLSHRDPSAYIGSRRISKTKTGVGDGGQEAGFSYNVPYSFLRTII
jgi:hypothetical protein